MITSNVVNPYVDWWDSASEQDLLQTLTTEFIRFHSMEVVYLPRTLRKEDTLYNEDILSNFTSTYKLPAYLRDIHGWGGAGDFLSKFGVQIKDQMNVAISREKFLEVFANTTINRPFEGDLIYFPRPMNKLFEIKFVEHEEAKNQFYPLGVLVYFDLKLELFTYNQEDFATGNNTLDIFETQKAYAEELTLTTGTGTYTVGETVYQGAGVASATARGIVGSWVANTGILSITYVSGVFANSIVVKGATSNASYVLSGTPNKLDLPNESNNDNDYLRTEALNILDANT